MKIQRLDLRAFGPFTGVSLDLAAGSEGFHLIYGPNEAGKTSALRALRNLLYGIPGNSADDFIHNKPSLRIGATLVRRDGQQLEIVRRKGNKGTLLPPDEKEPLDDAVLHSFLGGCDQAQFETMPRSDIRNAYTAALDVYREMLSWPRETKAYVARILRRFGGPTTLGGGVPRALVAAGAKMPTQL